MSFLSQTMQRMSRFFSYLFFSLNTTHRGVLSLNYCPCMQHEGNMSQMNIFTSEKTSCSRVSFNNHEVFDSLLQTLRWGIGNLHLLVKVICNSCGGTCSFFRVAVDSLALLCCNNEDSPVQLLSELFTCALFLFIVFFFM